MIPALCALLAGCGGGDSAGKDKNDKRATALDCLTNEQHLPARLLGKDSIQIDGPDSPRVQFFLTSGEAEAFQFEGRAEGTEILADQGNRQLPTAEGRQQPLDGGSGLE